ncbi:hypothetical protein [Protofrankia symbiont of Coriaria ruscifolia]|uniref:FAD/NAD(P)-binding domain-containing protein n=1 Tax=Candidatus Protofrankia californiensis TaxID=1839754 RepID=A0A1C3NZJ4_9ACTN|nr:hypothetical protein [Protofrankia symbiont of Coriaria ruscifolia]SBW22986.1 hypothetical protein FDG2_3395 [Candidatus Protofrankia californiensis]
MASTVAVVGGGYGGITVAKALDDIAEHPKWASSVPGRSRI